MDGLLDQPCLVSNDRILVEGIAAVSVLDPEGEPGSVERYIGFLRAGNSVPAIDALRTAGVDLGTPEPIERAFAVLERHVGELEGLA